jgi:hypothetical protein
LATRRKYRDGGRVPVIDNGAKFDKVDNVIIDEPAPPAAPVAAPAAPPPADDDPLVRAHRAQLHAEALQREAAKAAPSAQRPQTIEEHIDGLPISDFKKAALRANPHWLQGCPGNDSLCRSACPANPV